MRLHRIVITAGLTALLVSASPLQAAEPADAPKQPTDNQRIIELLKKIEDRLTAQVATTDVLMEIVRKDLKDLRDEVTRLEKQLADVRRTGSTSFYPSQTNPATSSATITPALPIARVRLVNTYLTEMTAIVNGLSYSVLPGQERVITVPAGIMNFQVLQIASPMQTRTLAANEILTLTLSPR